MAWQRCTGRSSEGQADGEPASFVLEKQSKSCPQATLMLPFMKHLI